MALEPLTVVVLVGAGATVVMDVWLLLLARLGIPLSSFALIGRWVGHFWRGRFAHPAIAKAQPVPGEQVLGWLTHYAVGIVFAAAFVSVSSPEWVVAPTLLPAIAFGLATVAAPWFVMQPAMGAGVAASKTAAPLANRVRSLANHAVFGAGLYLAAVAVGTFAP